MGETAGTSKANETELKEFIEREVKILQPPTTNPSIYRVPKEIRSGHEKLFEPISIPIGPLHYDDKSSAQEFKKWYLKNFIGRLEKTSENKLAEVMSNLESHFRECYRDIDPKMTGNKLVQIMLLDGCFIMELLWSHQDYHLDTLVGNIEKVPLLTLQQDLLKIENQLPFLVLETLADLAWTNQTNKSFSQGSRKPESNSLNVIDLALNFFNISKPENFKTTDRPSPRHLLELVMNALFHENEASFSHHKVKINEGGESSLVEAKSASELEYYGIKFRADRDSKNLTKLEFKNGNLIIPPLKIQESSATVLWNFLIFETSSCKSRIFTSYVVLMDTLINSEKDVEVLLLSKILLSRKNDTQSLVSLFNDMSANVSQTDFYFEPLVQELNQYCKSSYHPARAYLVRNYYDARWSVLSNILLFILTVTQTLFSVPGLKKGE